MNNKFSINRLILLIIAFSLGIASFVFAVENVIVATRLQADYKIVKILLYSFVIIFLLLLLAGGFLLLFNYRLKKAVAERTQKLRLLNKSLEEEIFKRNVIQDALERSKEHFEMLVEKSPVAIAVAENSNKIRFVNKKFKALLGYTFDDIKYVDDIWYKICPNLETRELIKAEWQRWIDFSSDQEAEFEPLMLWIRRKDGQQCYVELISSQVGDLRIIVISDCTQRKKAEKLSIQNEKMVSVGGLAAGMAHEINNPLGCILQGIQNVNRRFSDSLPANLKIADECGISLDLVHNYMNKRGISKFLTGISDAGERASKIVANILEFSRKTTGEKMCTNIEQLVDNALELLLNNEELSDKYKIKKIQICKSYSCKDKTLFCVEKEIELAILNILQNAVQVMGDWQGRIEQPQITIAIGEQKGNIVLEISDNGPGMDSETKKRVFDPFFTTSAVGRTGLGLYVAYCIVVDNHDGYISVESNPGEGTVFSVALPVNA